MSPVLRRPLTAGWLTVLLAGCGDGVPARAPAPPKDLRAVATPPEVLLVGIDGADLENIATLSSQGGLPNLTRLMERGVYGELETVANASPIVWTSIATGTRPERHGIEFFRLEGEPAASTMRRQPAFWNVLGHYGRSVGVLAWWATFPAERVEGYLVSPYVLLMPPRGTETRVERFWDPGDPRKTHPPDLQAALADLIYLDRDLDLESMPHLYADPVRTTNTGWALAKDRSYHEMTLRLLGERPVQTVAVYFQGVDAASHDFDRHVHGANVNRVRPPKVSAGEVERALARVDAMYEHLDGMLGELLARSGGGSDVLVVSDHGWSYDGTSHWNNDPGVFIAAGPSFAARGRFEGVTVLDVAPVLFALQGVPVARDLDGTLPTGLLHPEIEERLEWIDSYPLEPVALAADVDSAAPEDEAMLERLRSLGYLTGEDD